MTGLRTPAPLPPSAIPAAAPALARPWVAVAGLLLFFSILRLALVDLPLERDEGDYAYIAQLMLQGVPPYSGAHDMRLPGIFAAYAAILATLGQSSQAIRVGLLLMQLGTLALVYRLGARLLGSTAGIAACAAYGAFSLSHAVLGFTANTEHFVLLPTLAGLVLLLRAADSRRTPLVLSSGICFGAAALMKHHAVFFAAFAAAFLLWRAARSEAVQPPQRRALRLLVFALGCALPVALAVAAVAWAGSLDELVFWTVVYPVHYVTANSLADGLANLALTLPPVLRANSVVVGLAGLGAAAVVGDPRMRTARGFLGGLLLASLAALSAGLAFRPHAYLFLAPILSLLAGAAVAFLAERLAQRLRPGLVLASVVAVSALPLLQLLVVDGRFVFLLDPQSASRSAYGTSPFPESPVIADFIRARSTPADRIAVLGSEPQIYFYAQRRAATAHILTYPLMEPQPHALQMQQEMIREIETAAPRYLVFVSSPYSWLMRASSERRILDWFERYSARHYHRVGLVEIDAHGTRFFWDAAAAQRQPATPEWIGIYERRASR